MLIARLSLSVHLRTSASTPNKASSFVAHWLTTTPECCLAKIENIRLSKLFPIIEQTNSLFFLLPESHANERYKTKSLHRHITAQNMIRDFVDVEYQIATDTDSSDECTASLSVVLRSGRHTVQDRGLGILSRDYATVFIFNRKLRVIRVACVTCKSVVASMADECGIVKSGGSAVHRIVT